MNTTTVTYQVGDRVLSRRWEGHTGTVRRFDEDGDMFVMWDGCIVDCHETPNTVRPTD